MSRRRLYNCQRYILGFPDSGKTTLARSLAVADRRAGRYVVAHDPYEEYPCRRYATADAARAQLSQLPAAVAIGGPDVEPVCELAIALAERAPVPVSLFLDEMALAVETPGHTSQRERVLMTGRRHFGRGLGLTLLAQDLGVTGALWLRLCTELFLFRLTDQSRIRDIGRLTSVTGLEDVLPRLAPYQYVRCAPGADLRRNR